MANRWDFPHKSPAAAIRRCAHVSRKQTNATDIVSVSAVVRMVRGTGEVRTVSRRRNAQSGRPSENDGGRISKGVQSAMCGGRLLHRGPNTYVWDHKGSSEQSSGAFVVLASLAHFRSRAAGYEPLFYSSARKCESFAFAFLSPYVAGKPAEKSKGAAGYVLEGIELMHEWAARRNACCASTVERRTKYFRRERRGSTLKSHRGFLFHGTYCGRGGIGRRAG